MNYSNFCQNSPALPKKFWPIFKTEFYFYVLHMFNAEFKPVYRNELYFLFLKIFLFLWAYAPKIYGNIDDPKMPYPAKIKIPENQKGNLLLMLYTMVIIKIRFENLAVILHFPHFFLTNQTLKIWRDDFYSEWFFSIVL